MSFINKDERITSCQTKTKHNFIETSVTASFLTFFFPSRLELFCSMAAETSLALTSRPYIHRLFLFFLPPRFALFIFLFYRIAVSWLSYSVSMFGPTCLPLFSSHRPFVELLMLRKPTKSSCFLEDIHVPSDCKQQINTKH